MSLATVTADPIRPASRAHANPNRSVEGFFRELAPDWHSQWAWDHYEPTILNLARQFGLRRVCEIGGGRPPRGAARGLEAPGRRFRPQQTREDKGQPGLASATLPK